MWLVWFRYPLKLLLAFRRVCFGFLLLVIGNFRVHWLTDLNLVLLWLCRFPVVRLLFLLAFLWMYRYINRCFVLKLVLCQFFVPLFVLATLRKASLEVKWVEASVNLTHYRDSYNFGNLLVMLLIIQDELKLHLASIIWLIYKLVNKGCSNQLLSLV